MDVLLSAAHAFSRRDAHLVLELLAELQGDGEEHQRVIEPRHHTLHLVNMAHFEPVVVELTVEGKCQKGHALFLHSVVLVFSLFIYTLSN